jgi:hypothetical protein
VAGRGSSCEVDRAEGALVLHPVPGGEDEACGAVFAVLAEFLPFQDAEGLGGEAGAVDVGGVEDVAELVAGEALEAGVGGVDLGAQMGAALLVPGEGRAGEAEILGPGAQVVGGEGEFEEAREEEGEDWPAER